MKLPPKPPVTTETSLLVAIRAALAEMPGVALFRNNTGMLQDIRRRSIRYGLGIGSPDLVGWVTLNEAWGTDPLPPRYARFFALEVKREGQQLGPAQREWLQRINRAGGYAQVVYSVEQARFAATEAQAGASLRD